jgi:hypothetical protein
MWNKQGICFAPLQASSLWEWKNILILYCPFDHPFLFNGIDKQIKFPH